METRSLCDLLGGLAVHGFCWLVDSTSVVVLAGVLPLGLVFDGWDVADGFEKPFGVPPIHPAEGGQFDVLDGPPGPLHGDQLCLVEADDRFGHGVVVGVSFRTDGGDGSFFCESFGVSD